MNSTQQHFEPFINNTVWKWLFKKALRMVDFNWHKAEDAVQQVFLQLISDTRYDPSKCSQLHYAYRRLQNVTYCLEDRERRNRRKISAISEVRLPFSTGSNSTENREEADRVEQVIDTLSPVHRMAIKRHLRGETLQEVAKKMGRSQNTMQQLESQAANAIRMALSNS